MYKPGQIVKAARYAEPIRVNGDERLRELKDIPGVCVVVREYLGRDGRYLVVFSQSLMKRYEIPVGFASPITKVENAVKQFRKR